MHHETLGLDVDTSDPLAPVGMHILALLLYHAVQARKTALKRGTSNLRYTPDV